MQRPNRTLLRIMLFNLQKILKPGGLIIVGTPNFGLHNRMGKSLPALSSSFEHLHYFDANSLQKILELERYQIISILSCNAIDPISSMVNSSKSWRYLLALWFLVKRILWFVYPLYQFVRAQLSQKLKESDVHNLLWASLVVIARHEEIN